jgi:Rad3-related DNA helicase
MSGYADFLATKAVVDPMTGIENIGSLPADMMGHQSDITSWGLRRGRAAVFAGTGLGKTYMELVWADRVARETNKPVLIYAPLAVTVQHKREADKFGIDASIVRRNEDLKVGINLANYGKMDHFDHASLGGIALDESSILKNYQGKTRTRLIDECKSIPYRLAATATPAPNDYMHAYPVITHDR